MFIEAMHRCTLCQAHFTLKNNKIRHEAGCGKRKRFSCVHCSKLFLRKDSLRRHILGQHLAQPTATVELPSFGDEVTQKNKYKTYQLANENYDIGISDSDLSPINGGAKYQQTNTNDDFEFKDTYMPTNEGVKYKNIGTQTNAEDFESMNTYLSEEDDNDDDNDEDIDINGLVEQLKYPKLGDESVQSALSAFGEAATTSFDKIINNDSKFDDTDLSVNEVYKKFKIKPDENLQKFRDICKPTSEAIQPVDEEYKKSLLEQLEYHYSKGRRFNHPYCQSIVYQLSCLGITF